MKTGKTQLRVMILCNTYW